MAGCEETWGQCAISHTGRGEEDEPDSPRRDGAGEHDWILHRPPREQPRFRRGAPPGAIGTAERVCCAHGRSEVDAGAATLHSAVLHYGSDPRRVRSGTCGTFQRSLLEPRGSRDVPPSVRSTCRNPQQGKWYLRNKVSYSSGASIMVSSRLSSKRCLQACA